MAEQKNKRLGMGLTELLGEDNLFEEVTGASEENEETSQEMLSNNEGEETFLSQQGLRNIPIDLIIPYGEQPRKMFHVEHLEDLAKSIKEKGILQPILVRWHEDKKLYELVAGERRWRASQMAGLHEIPAIVQNVPDNEALENSIIENIQREDLNPVEVSQAIRQLVDKYGYTHDQVSDVLGKSRSHITNLLRIMTLPEKVLEALMDGKITLGHAKVLLSVEDIDAYFETLLAKNLSVRELERLSQGQPKTIKQVTFHNLKDQDTLALENDLSSALGIRVKINHRANKSGTITLHYETIEQLDEICRRLCEQYQE